MMIESLRSAMIRAATTSAIKQQCYKSSIFRYQKNRCIGTGAGAAASRSATTHSHVHQSILTNIHPQHLYQIVNNVDKYKDFLPYCHESKILQISPCGTMMDAVLRVGLPGLSFLSTSGSNNSLLEERYVSRVKMIPANETTPFWTVEAKSIRSNLFDSLKSRWQLSLIDEKNANDVNGQQQQQTTGPSCNVNFEVEMQLSNSLISFTLDRVLKDVANAQVEAFEKRCRAVPYLDNDESEKL